MHALFAAALERRRFLEARQWRFCFIGGLAVQGWGQPRLTLDVDCTLLTGFGHEARYVDELPAAFAGRVDNPRESIMDDFAESEADAAVMNAGLREAPPAGDVDGALGWS